MPWYDVIWIYDDPEGNVAHIAEHGLTPEDVEPVLKNPDREGLSDSTGRLMCVGDTIDGRRICVIYEKVDEISVYPVTAYEVEH